MNKKEFLKIKMDSYKSLDNETMLSVYINKYDQYNRLENTLKNSTYKVDKNSLWEYLKELKEAKNFLREEILKRMEK